MSGKGKGLNIGQYGRQSTDVLEMQGKTLMCTQSTTYCKNKAVL